MPIYFKHQANALDSRKLINLDLFEPARSRHDLFACVQMYMFRSKFALTVNMESTY